MSFGEGGEGGKCLLERVRRVGSVFWRGWGEWEVSFGEGKGACWRGGEGGRLDFKMT